MNHNKDVDNVVSVCESTWQMFFFSPTSAPLQVNGSQNHPKKNKRRVQETKKTLVHQID